MTVGDTECDVQTVEDTEVTCITNSNGHSVETKVLVTLNRERSVEVSLVASGNSCSVEKKKY